jgi:hypothetical protein
MNFKFLVDTGAQVNLIDEIHGTKLMFRGDQS